MGTLKRWLYTQPQPFLIGMAELWGVVVPKAAHKRSVEILLEAASDEELVREIVLGCSARAKEALSFVIGEKGSTTINLFSSKYGERRPMGPGAMEREKPWRSPRNVTEELWYKGLIIESSSKIEGKIVETYEIPEELLPVISSMMPNGVKPNIPSEHCECHEAPHTLGNDLTMLLSYLYNHKIRTTETGGLAKKDIKAIAARIGSDSRTFVGSKLDFLWTLCSENGLIERSERRLSIDRDRTVRWLGLSASSAESKLIQMWLESREWDDLCKIPNIRCSDDFYHNSVATRRKFLEILLEWTSPSRTYSIGALVSAFEEWAPDFNRPSGDYADAQIFDSISGEKLSGREHWEEIEGRLIKELLARTMRWLGIADTCPGICFKWSKIGRDRVKTLFQGAEHHFEKDNDEPAIRFLESMDFLLFWHAAPRQVFRACRIADWKSRILEGTIFSLSQASLKRAVLRGITVNQVIEFLENASGGEIPSRFREFLIRHSKG